MSAPSAFAAVLRRVRATSHSDFPRHWLDPSFSKPSSKTHSPWPSSSREATTLTRVCRAESVGLRSRSLRRAAGVESPRSSWLRMSSSSWCSAGVDETEVAVEARDVVPVVDVCRDADGG